jgi:hypothetical protein
MSNMLEQAIADAATLREQAIKNAEQSVIEKYSQQIKEAVDQMLEADEDPMAKVDEVINEAEEELNEEAEAPIAGMGVEPQGAQIEAPPSWDSRYDDMMTNFSALVDNLPTDDDGMIDLDLGDFEMDQEEEDALGQEETEDMPLGEPEMDLGGLGAEPEGDDTSMAVGGLDDLLSEPLQEEINLDEVADAVSEMLEGMEVDFDSRNAAKGVWRHNESREDFNADMAEIEFDSEEESEEESVDEEKEELMGKVNELHETVKSLTQQNKQLESVLTKLEVHLEESLLSNAKLLYQNRTLGDASLNERQKSKIVEAIANAESPKEAKRLHETLKATVGSTPNSKKGPQSLSESVNRRSNLSSMLNTRQNINESKTADPFLEKMQKLAGIKK